MKNILFRKAILLPLLFASFSLFAQDPTIITYPLNNSVFQQNSNGQANISIAGQILKGGYLTEFSMQSLYISVEQYNYSTKVWNLLGNFKFVPTACVNCDVTSVVNDPRIFYTLGGTTIPTLNKGWYRAKVIQGLRCVVVGSNQILIYRTQSSTVNFGVGDVYMIAGQSNASGFTRIYDTNLMTYESNSLNGSPKISDNDILEGSIINRITTNNRDDNLRAVRGLPVFSNSNVGLKKFISGKFGDTNEMGIAPNGKDSWSWSRFSNNLVASKGYPVLLFNTAIPNTSMAQWRNTYFASNLKPMLQMYGGAFGSKAILWQQGENETELITQSSTYNLGTNYSDHFEKIIEWSRSQAIANLPWVISKTSFIVKLAPASDPRLTSADFAMNYISSRGFTKKVFANRGIPPNSNNLINSQTTILNYTTNLYAGPDTEPNTSTGIGELDERYRGPGQRLHFDGVQGLNGKNGLQVLAERWVSAVSSMPTNANTVARQASRIKVTKSGGQYELTVEDDLGNALTSGNFYWVVGDGGINAKETNTAIVPSGQPYKYKIPTSVSSDYFITCNYQSNLNEVLTPAQPYLIKSNCNGCRIGAGQSTATLMTSRSLSSGGGTTSVSYGNIKEDFAFKLRNCLPPWLTLNSDGISSLVITASANTTGSTRSETIIIENENGVAYLTIPVTQTVATPSGCTSVSLTGGAFWPSNPQSEWSGNGISMQYNKTVQGATLQVNGQQQANGIGVHSNSRIVYNINNNYSTFTGWVGRDDEQDACGCGTQRVRFQVIGNGELLWTSNLLDHTSPPQPFTINVAGKSTLELLMDDGGDNSWGDHGDWLKPELNCTNVPVCNVPQPTIPVSSIYNVTSGISVTLSTSCTTGIPIWSGGETGTTIIVNPSITTTYTVYCQSGTCNSDPRSITITSVNASLYNQLSNNLVLGTWNVTTDQLVVRQFNGQYWLTQRAYANPDQFVVRGSEMLQRTDVALLNPIYSTMVGCFAYQYSGYQGLITPTAAQFPTPVGYSNVYWLDGTPNFLQNNPSSPPAYNGYFDQANCGSFSGWVWNSAAPSIRQVVEIMEGSNVVTYGTANGYRADLQAAGIGDGYYTFNIPTPASLKNGASRTLWARVQGSSYQLNSSPKSINCLSMGARVGNFEAVSQEEKLEGMVVSPNPSDGIFNVSCSAKKGERISLLVLNMSGVVVLKQDFMADDDVMHHVFSIKNQPNGPYIINLRTGSTNYNQRIVKID